MKTTSEMERIRALQVWAVLTYAASKSQTMTYKELGDSIGVFWRNTREPLRLIMEYCACKQLHRNRELPKLTALVVDGQTGAPNNWDDEKLKGWHQELRNIFNDTKKWRQRTPTLEDLERFPKPKKGGAE